jgi:hypothetical protein
LSGKNTINLAAGGVSTGNNFANGLSSSTALGNSLATNFNNMYGADAGSSNLTGKTNSQIASFYQNLFSTVSKKLEAQTMALALAVYVTNSRLAGNVATSTQVCPLQQFLVGLRFTSSFKAGRGV